MNAINSLWQPASEANYNVRALLGSTEEVVARTKTFCRWWQLWRPEARAGWTTLGRFKVPVLCPLAQASLLGTLHGAWSAHSAAWTGSARLCLKHLPTWALAGCCMLQAAWAGSRRCLGANLSPPEAGA